MVVIGGGDLSVDSDNAAWGCGAGRPYLDRDRECVGQSALCVTIRLLPPVGATYFLDLEEKSSANPLTIYNLPLNYSGVSAFPTTPLDG